MLHRPERNNHQWIFLFEAEIAHVTVMGANPFAHIRRFPLDLLAKNAEHGQRTVDTVNGGARTGDGQQHAAGAATNFENRPADALCQVHIERPIDEICHGRVGAIVVFSQHGVRVDSTGHLRTPTRTASVLLSVCRAPITNTAGITCKRSTTASCR